MAAAGLADENFNRRMLQAVRRVAPGVDVVTVQEAGISGAPDPEVLAYAAREGRILLTHDEDTMTAHAIERVRRGLRMPGVVVVRWRRPIGSMASDLVVLLECSREGEHEGQILFLPL